MIQPLRDDLMVQQQLPHSIYLNTISPRQINRAAAWCHMTAVIMLNQTGRVPVKTVAPVFWDRWSYATEFLVATESEVKDVIWPLGLVNVRYQRLRRMSEQFMLWDEWDDAQKLYGIGRYGSDSYEIFFKQNYQVQPTDKELRRYLEEDVRAISI